MVARIVETGIFLPWTSIESIEPLTYILIESPFGKLTLSGINAFSAAFDCERLEKGMRMETEIS